MISTCVCYDFNESGSVGDGTDRRATGTTQEATEQEIATTGRRRQRDARRGSDRAAAERALLLMGHIGATRECQYGKHKRKFLHDLYFH